MKYRDKKISTFGSFNEVKKISSCFHEWVAGSFVLFECVKVEAQCSKCKTYWSLGAYKRSNEQ